MSITVKSGALTEFFASIKHTAQELDSKAAVTQKHTIWMESEDLSALLKPQRTELLRYLRNREEITLDELVDALHRSKTGLNRDLNLLSKYNLVHILRNTPHTPKRIRPTFVRETLEFVAQV